MARSVEWSTTVLSTVCLSARLPLYLPPLPLDLSPLTHAHPQFSCCRQGKRTFTLFSSLSLFPSPPILLSLSVSKCPFMLLSPLFRSLTHSLTQSTHSPPHASFENGDEYDGEVGNRDEGEGRLSRAEKEPWTIQIGAILPSPCPHPFFLCIRMLNWGMVAMCPLWPTKGMGGC